MSGATDLYDLAKELLDFCVVALDELPAGAPDRRYVAFGLPAIDCEQLTVHTFQMGEASTVPQESVMDTFRRANPYPRLNIDYLVVTIVRDCYPGPTLGSTPTTPDVDDLVAASQVLYADGWQIWNAVKAGIEDGELFTRAGCRFIGWQPMQPLGPEGNTAGWTFPLLVQLDGFTPPPPV